MGAEKIKIQGVSFISKKLLKSHFRDPNKCIFNFVFWEVFLHAVSTTCKFHPSLTKFLYTLMYSALLGKNIKSWRGEGKSWLLKKNITLKKRKGNIYHLPYNIKAVGKKIKWERGERDKNLGEENQVLKKWGWGRISSACLPASTSSTSCSSVFHIENIANLNDLITIRP